MTTVIALTRGPTQIARAFVRMGYLATTAYPIAFATNQLFPVVPLFVFFFLARIVRSSGPSVGGSYFTFFALGLVTFLLIGGTLRGLSQELDDTIQQGRMEILLIEPIRWPLLPLGMSLWPATLSLATALLVGLVSVALGARYQVGGIPAAALLAFLGIVSAIGIGLLTTSFKLLAKKSDPVFALYNVLASLLAGQTFPINVLPHALRPLSWAVPSMYATAGIRKALMPASRGIYGPGPLEAVLGLLVFDAALYVLGFWLLNRTLEYGRKMGILAAY